MSDRMIRAIANLREAHACGHGSKELQQALDAWVACVDEDELGDTLRVAGMLRVVRYLRDRASLFQALLPTEPDLAHTVQVKTLALLEAVSMIEKGLEGNPPTEAERVRDANRPGLEELIRHLTD